MPFVTATANAILNCYFDGTNITAPTTRFIGLFTSTPIADGSGGVEVSGSGYARQSLSTATASSRQIASDAAMDFTSAAPAAWGTIVAWGLFSAATGGTLHFFDSVNPQLVVGSGSPVSVPVGQLIVQLPA